MRVLIQLFGSSGDVHPFIGLGRELTRRGHEVIVVVNKYFGDLVQRSGLTLAACGNGEEFARSLRHADLWHPRKGLRTVVEGGVVPGLQPAYETLAGLVLPGRTVVVGSSWSLAAHLLAETHDLPFVMSHLQPMAFRSVHRAPRFPGLTLPDAMPAPFKRAAYRLMDLVVDPLLCPPLNALRATQRAARSGSSTDY